MGSSSKRYKEKESRKRRHRSPSNSEEYEAAKERRHKHKKHHRDRRREKPTSNNYESDGSDVVEVIPDDDTSPPPSAPQDSSAAQSSDSLSIVETNKLRAKLGLKPLEINTNSSSSSSQKKGSTSSNSDGKKKDDLGEFYHRPAENWAEKAEREKMKMKLAIQKEKRQIQNKLGKVKLLGEIDSDDDDDDDDTENWVNKSRLIDNAKKEADKRAKMLEELDEQFGVSDIIESEQREKRKQQYSEKNLKGLHVEHAADSFADERTIILTLKDQGILEDKSDVLVNVNMLDNERYQKSNENKKKKIIYNAYEDQEFDEFGNPKEKSLLAQYDEEIDGVKKDGFKIGYDNIIERKQNLAQTIKEKLAKKKLETIINKDLILASDYYNEQELEKFKKPKKKIRKIRTKGKLLTADDLKQTNNKGIESVGSRRPKVKQDLGDYDIDDIPAIPSGTESIKIEDEDEKDNLLEKALHKARRLKQKENLIGGVSNVGDDIMNEIIKIETAEDNAGVDNGNIILNATAEFCRTLGDIPTYGKAGNREETDDMIDFDKDLIQDEDLDNDEIDYEEKTGWNSVDPNEARQSIEIVPQEVQILDEEPDVSTGMGAALKLAMSKGYLDKEQKNRPSNSRLAHLQAKHYSIEDKTYGDESDRTNRRERYAGPIMEFKEKDCFKPNVKLEYIDDDGHILNSKEAFRYLSHKFHGKGPGKNKVEKRLKKSVQEQLMKKMSSTDTPLGTLNMLQAKQKETQSAFVVLSGNKQNQSTVISKSRR